MHGNIFFPYDSFYENYPEIQIGDGKMIGS